MIIARKVVSNSRTRSATSFPHLPPFSRHSQVRITIIRINNSSNSSSRPSTTICRLSNPRCKRRLLWRQQRCQCSSQQQQRQYLRTILSLSRSTKNCNRRAKYKPSSLIRAFIQRQNFLVLSTIRPTKTRSKLNNNSSRHLRKQHSNSSKLTTPWKRNSAKRIKIASAVARRPLPTSSNKLRWWRRSIGIRISWRSSSTRCICRTKCNSTKRSWSQMTFSLPSPFCHQKTFSRQPHSKHHPWWTLKWAWIFNHHGSGSVSLCYSRLWRSKTSKLRHRLKLKLSLKRRYKRRHRRRPKCKHKHKLLKCKSRSNFNKWISAVNSCCHRTQLQRRKLLTTSKCLTRSSAITSGKQTQPHSRTSSASQASMAAWVVRWASTWTPLTKCTKCHPTHRCSNSLPRTN